MKKIICIRHSNWEDLTIGKTYDVVREGNDWYDIKDDVGFIWGYPKIRFKTLSEIRNEKIDKLFN